MWWWVRALGNKAAPPDYRFYSQLDGASYGESRIPAPWRETLAFKQHGSHG